MNCPYCNRAKELRPYGPKGSMICFDCLTATPEMEAEGKRNFSAQLDACGQAALIGLEAGPVPATEAQLRAVAATPIDKSEGK